MRILFTGGSSFTGYWFIRELHAAGHTVVATFRRQSHEYEDDRRSQRVALAASMCRPIYGASFGDDTFRDLVRTGEWDVLAHHAADVTNYKSDDFDTVTALRNNTLNLAAVLTDLGARGCRGVILTGSAFEGGEGAGSEGLPHFSPYGLSKALTAEVFRYYCGRANFPLVKFVIPNPFGAYEDPRYTSYLMKSWLGGGTPRCSNPLYVRDNIHVSLLAKIYVKVVEQISGNVYQRINPSGYVETQGSFTQRIAEAMRARLGLPCPFELGLQTQFTEPRVRINTDVPDVGLLGFDETLAWDEMVNWYRKLG